MKRFVLLTLILAILLSSLSSCTVLDKTDIDPASYVETTEKTNLVKMHISTASGRIEGDVYIRLYPEAAPITVENFQALVSEGFYDGLTFHRLVANFCLQGGDPKGTGLGGSGSRIKGEFSANGHNNPLLHEERVVSMARGGYSYDSASSQFFFTLKSGDNITRSLDGLYAAFGYVVAGWDVIVALSHLDVDYNDNPRDTVTMESVVFVTKAESK